MEVGEFVWVPGGREDRLGIYLGPNELGDAIRVLRASAFYNIEEEFADTSVLSQASPTSLKKKHVRQAIGLLSDYYRVELAKLKKQVVELQQRKEAAA